MQQGRVLWQQGQDRQVPCHQKAKGHAKTEHKDIRKGMDLGADDYLTKPFEEDELISAIESRLAKMAILNKLNENNKTSPSAAPEQKISSLQELRQNPI